VDEVDLVDKMDEVGGVDLGDGAQPGHRVIGAGYQEPGTKRG
jgi:hypothetical protein